MTSLLLPSGCEDSLLACLSSLGRLLLQFIIYYYCLALTVLILRRLVFNRLPSSKTLSTKKIMVVFGSGGHTTEMLLMLTKDNKFDFSKYRQVTFVIGHSDTWSLRKINDFFSRGVASAASDKSKDFNIERDVPNLQVVKLFRSREVK